MATPAPGRRAPHGADPDPRRIAVYTNACNTYLKWAEIWERMYDIPHRYGGRSGKPGGPRASAGPKVAIRTYERDRRYVEYPARAS